MRAGCWGGWPLRMKRHALTTAQPWTAHGTPLQGNSRTRARETPGRAPIGPLTHQWPLQRKQGSGEASPVFDRLLLDNSDGRKAKGLFSAHFEQRSYDMHVPGYYSGVPVKSESQLFGAFDLDRHTHAEK